MEIKAQLKKPYTQKERMDFIVEYNHNQGLIISENEEYIFAYVKTETNEDKISRIKSELNKIDLKSIRALRCQEQDRLALLESEAVILRQELNEIMKGENYEH